MTTRTYMCVYIYVCGYECVYKFIQNIVLLISFQIKSILVLLTSLCPLPFQSVVKLMQGLLQCMMRQVQPLTLWSLCLFAILTPSIELYRDYTFFYSSVNH